MEAQDNGKEATGCCYNIHYSIDELFLHQEKQGCTSAVKEENLVIHEHPQNVATDRSHISYLKEQLELQEATNILTPFLLEL